MNFAFRALTALHQFFSPDATSDEDCMKSFCNECYSNKCRHCIPSKTNLEYPLPLGNQIENIMASHHPLTEAILAETSKLPETGWETVKEHCSQASPVKRTILPPPAPSEEKNASSSVIVNANSDEFVPCNFCQLKVKTEYLTQHLNAHTHSFTPPANQTSSANDTTTVTVKQNAALASISIPLLSRGSISEPNKSKIPHIKSTEHYKFRRIDAAVAAASVDQSGRYSDFTVSFLLKEKTSFCDGSWHGGVQYASKDMERFIIHVVYDNMEDYFMVSTKISKRSSFSTYDTEEPAPDRICLQEELLTDIKRSLLFFGIPPRVAYKIFRKLFKNNSVNVEYDKNGRACLSETSNSKEINSKFLPAKQEYSYHGFGEN
jgi:hypothetical protein